MNSIPTRSARINFNGKMSVLNLKLIRDLKRSRWQYLAVIAMIMLGIAFYCAAYMTYKNLNASYDYSYNQLHFEHIGIALNGAPERAVERIRRLPGVARVEGRWREDVELELPNRQSKRFIGRLIGIPADRRPQINDVVISEGRYLSPGTEREVLMEQSFAKHHRLKPGDQVIVKRQGQTIRLRMVGIARSPEYIYVVQSKQDLMPMPDTFGVMFVAQEVLGSLLGKSGLINEVKVTAQAPDHLMPLLRETKRALSSYRPEEPVPREDQPSYQLMQQDVEGFRAYAVLFPVLFLSVSGLTVYTLLMRAVHLQRPVIGVLRALGISRRGVVIHYLASAAVLGAIGSLLGIAAGYPLGGWATRAYLSMTSVPYTQFAPQSSVMLVGVCIGLSVCLIAAILPARAAAAINPAEAMRPPKPSASRVPALDHILPKLSLLWRIPIRNLFRQPKRSLSTLFGIVAAMALLMTAQGILDSSQATINEMFAASFREDLRAQFLVHQDRHLVNQVRSWRGVVWAEPVLQIPVEFIKGNQTYSALLTGLEPGTRLYGLTSDSDQPISVRYEGAIFGPTLRKRLKLERGDQVKIRLPKGETEEETREKIVRVAGFNWEPIGTVAYLPLDELRRLFRNELSLPPGAVSSILIKAAPGHEEEIRRRLNALPQTAAVSSTSDIRKMIDSMMELSRRFVFIMLLFGMGLGFSILFNMVTINVLERSNEVATLRTIGVSRAQIIGMITLENMLIGVIGALIGLPVGRLFVEGFITAASSEEQMELFAFRVTILPSTYALTAFLILIVMFFSQLPAILSLNRMNLAKSAKERAT